jgi:hypothetical protein
VSKRPIISLPSPAAAPAENREITLTTYDVLLPCRRFDISYKVAVVGRVSLTAEFLLRLLKSADGLDEGIAASFFGFNSRDMSFVLAEVETNGYCERKNGKLWLTLAGQSLFRDGSDNPAIFEIESVHESVAFDLLALAPERFQMMEAYAGSLPELKIANSRNASDASTLVPAAFRRFFMEIMIAKGRSGENGTKRSIYSVDHVEPGDRFLAPVTITVKASSATPWIGEADLSEWRSDQELQDRTPVGDAASAFVQALHVGRRGTDSEAYRFLTDVAPEFLKEFIRTDGLAVERFYKEALSRRGQLRRDRPTIPLLGALTNKDNVERLIDALSRTAKSTARPSRFAWVKPQVPYWGATRILPETLKQLKYQIPQDSGDQEVRSVCLATGKPEQYLTRMFDEVYSTDQARFPSALEILIVPGFVTAILIHAPIKVLSGHAVPLGVLSFDPDVVSRVQDILLKELPAYGYAHDREYDELNLALSTPVSSLSDPESLSDDGRIASLPEHDS